jgi:hypothetical protein
LDGAIPDAATPAGVTADGAILDGADAKHCPFARSIFLYPAHQHKGRLSQAALVLFPKNCCNLGHFKIEGEKPVPEGPCSGQLPKSRSFDSLRSLLMNKDVGGAGLQIKSAS